MTLNPQPAPVIGPRVHAALLQAQLDVLTGGGSPDHSANDHARAVLAMLDDPNALNRIAAQVPPPDDSGDPGLGPEHQALLASLTAGPDDPYPPEAPKVRTGPRRRMVGNAEYEDSDDDPVSNVNWFSICPRVKGRCLPKDSPEGREVMRRLAAKEAAEKGREPAPGPTPATTVVKSPGTATEATSKDQLGKRLLTMKMPALRAFVKEMDLKVKATSAKVLVDRILDAVTKRSVAGQPPVKPPRVQPADPGRGTGSAETPPAVASKSTDKLNETVKQLSEDQLDKGGGRYRDVTDRLPGYQKSAISAYTGTAFSFHGSNYQQVNKQLRTGIDQGKGWIIKGMQDAFRDTPPLKKPLQVYRGMGFENKEETDKFMKEYEDAARTGKQVAASGFMSTSRNLAKAADYADAEGTPIMMSVAAKHVVSAEGLSGGINWEVIMNHGAKFNVLGITEKRIKDQDGNSKKFKVIHMEQVS